MYPRDLLSIRRLMLKGGLGLVGLLLFAAALYMVASDATGTSPAAITALGGVLFLGAAKAIRTRFQFSSR